MSKHIETGMKSQPAKHSAEDEAELLRQIDASPVKAVYMGAYREDPANHRLIHAARAMGGRIRSEHIGQDHVLYREVPNPAGYGWFWVPPYRETTLQHFSTGKGFVCGLKRPPGRPIRDRECQGDPDMQCPACAAARRAQYASIIDDSWMERAAAKRLNK